MTSSFFRRTLMQGAGAAFLLSALGIRSLPAMAAVPGPSADTLVFLNYRDLRDLNPHLYGGEMFAQEMLFEGLITLGQRRLLPSRRCAKLDDLARRPRLHLQDPQGDDVHGRRKARRPCRAGELRRSDRQQEAPHMA